MMERDCQALRGLLVACTLQGKKAKGIKLTLVDSTGKQFCEKETGPGGTAWFWVETAGEYLVKAVCPLSGSVPKAWWARVWLDPGQYRELSFLFRKTVHRGLGSITITLQDAFYHNLPLEGGTYQLWQVF